MREAAAYAEGMIRVVLSAAVLFGAATACSTVEEARSGVDQARSSIADARSTAASIGAASRQVCRATEDELKTANDLSTRLADDPSLKVQLAPQVRQVADRLATEVGGKTEFQPVVEAARELASAVGQANEATVRATASQAKVAVKAAQTACAVLR